MRTLSFHLILALTVIGAFAGCQAGPRSDSDGEPVIQDNQWPALLAQRENQPMAEWLPGSGSIEATTSGSNTGGVAFRESPSHLAEYAGRKALERNPRLFVPLLASKDPQVALTAIWVYRVPGWREEMGPDDRDAVAKGFRALLDHEDVRMRWAAVQILGENRMLTVADVAKGLADMSADVRATAGFWAGSVSEGAEWDTKSSTKEERIKVSREIDRELIPVLIAHLDDPDFRVRGSCAGKVLPMVPCTLKIKKPAYCDFVRAGWAEYTQAKATWQAWWKEHGEEALAAAD